ncbi:MAG TPA: hypothetical protein VEH84_12250, partial [Alphaproteobacteria bacterium]|nr:hypothetical protein [Alphaproteobacteria bacterium]
IGLAGAALPVEHFFTIDAATFLASAVALLLLRRALPYQVPAVPPHWREALTGGLRLVRRHALARYAILSSAVCNGTWYLGFILGMALLVQERWPGDLQAYGFVIAAYGCGNLAANLVVASVPIRRPAVRLLASRLFYGLGVAALALPLPLPATCAIAAVAAIGGPLGDMTILHILQTDFPPGDLARLYRLRMAAVQGATLLALLAAPWLYGAIGVAAAVCLSGLAAAAAGLGAVRFIVNRGQLCIHSKA